MCGALQYDLIEAWRRNDTGSDESGAGELEVMASRDLGHFDAERSSDPDKVCRTSDGPIVNCRQADGSCNLDVNVSTCA